MLEFDDKKQTFKNLEDYQKLALKEELLGLIIDGHPVYCSPFFVEWCHHYGYSDTQRLMIMSTAYPQRALLALID